MFSSIKLALYGGILALVLGLAWWVYHKGETHVEAQDTKAVAVAETKVKVAESTANASETQSAIIYKQAVSIPAIGDLGIVCRAPGGGKVPTAQPGATAGAREPSADSGVGSAYDPSGAALTRARDADAQIEYLQRRVKQLEAEMNAAP